MRAVLVLAAAVAGAVVLAAQPAPPKLEIAFPPPDGYVSGPVTIHVRIEPATVAVARMTFYADGRLVCTIDRPPFECAWDAGVGVNEHQVRVVAVLADGRRLVDTVRTKGVEYAEIVDVDAIQVTVTVTDDSGQFVRGLRREAFRVFEDDVPQKISHFASHNSALEVTADVDVSGSMTAAIPELKRSVRKFLSALRPTDKVTLYAFNDNIFTLARASVDPNARLRAVERLAAWGGTALYDVIVRSVEGLGRQIGRRALVVFSDGEDTASHITLEAAERRLKMSDATVYTIAQGRATRLGTLRAVLERLARTSGGRSFSTESVEELGQAFDAILDELSNQYLLAYTPPEVKRDGAWHRIRVRVNPEKYNVRAREGYLAPGKQKR